MGLVVRLDPSTELGQGDLHFGRMCVPLFLAALSACGEQEIGRSVEAAVLKVDTIASSNGLELLRPVAARLGPNGDIYILDAGNSELYRVLPDGGVDTLARAGSGPGELKRPSAFEWLDADSLLIVDEGNGRIQIVTATGRPVRMIAYAEGAADVVLDAAARRLYALAFARNLTLVNGRPVLHQDWLVAVVSLRRGDVVARFGAPWPYDGRALPFVGNSARLARDPLSGLIWLAWPLETHVARYTADGALVATFRRPLGFKTSIPREIPPSGSGTGRINAQVITFDIDADSAGRLYVLTAISGEPSRGLRHDGGPARAQAVDVFDDRGTLVCRIRLPFVAWTVSLAEENTLILTDVIASPDVYRIEYRCPNLCNGPTTRERPGASPAFR